MAAYVYDYGRFDDGPQWTSCAIVSNMPKKSTTTTSCSRGRRGICGKRIKVTTSARAAMAVQMHQERTRRFMRHAPFENGLVACVIDPLRVARQPVLVYAVFRTNERTTRSTRIIDRRAYPGNAGKARFVVFAKPRAHTRIACQRHGMETQSDHS